MWTMWVFLLFKAAQKIVWWYICINLPYLTPYILQCDYYAWCWNNILCSPNVSSFFFLSTLVPKFIPSINFYPRQSYCCWPQDDGRSLGSGPACMLCMEDVPAWGCTAISHYRSPDPPMTIVCNKSYRGWLVGQNNKLLDLSKYKSIIISVTETEHKSSDMWLINSLSLPRVRFKPSTWHECSISLSSGLTLVWFQLLPSSRFIYELWSFCFDCLASDIFLCWAAALFTELCLSFKWEKIIVWY